MLHDQAPCRLQANVRTKRALPGGMPLSCGHPRGPNQPHSKLALIEETSKGSPPYRSSAMDGIGCIGGDLMQLYSFSSKGFPDENYVAVPWRLATPLLAMHLTVK